MLAESREKRDRRNLSWEDQHLRLSQSIHLSKKETPPSFSSIPAKVFCVHLYRPRHSRPPHPPPHSISSRLVYKSFIQSNLYTNIYIHILNIHKTSILVPHWYIVLSFSFPFSFSLDLFSSPIHVCLANLLLIVIHSWKFVFRYIHSHLIHSSPL